MKALVCGHCVSILGLPQDMAWVECRCRNARARWIDPVRGAVAVEARDRDEVRIMGIHNGFLCGAFVPPRRLHTYDYWRDLHERLITEAEGYLFHKDRHGCPVVFIRVGASSDTFWLEDPNRPPALWDDEVPPNCRPGPHRRAA